MLRTNMSLRFFNLRNYLIFQFKTETFIEPYDVSVYVSLTATKIMKRENVRKC